MSQPVQPTELSPATQNDANAGQLISYNLLTPGFSQHTVSEIKSAFMRAGSVTSTTVTVCAPAGLPIHASHLQQITGAIQRPEHGPTIPIVVQDSSLPDNFVTMVIAARNPQGVFMEIFRKRFAAGRLGGNVAFVQLLTLVFQAVIDFGAKVRDGDLRSSYCILAMVALVISALYSPTRIAIAVLNNLMAGHAESLPAQTGMARRQNAYLNGAGINAAIAAGLQISSLFNGQGSIPMVDATFAAVQVIVGVSQFTAEVMEQWGDSITRKSIYSPLEC